MGEGGNIPVQEAFPSLCAGDKLFHQCSVSFIKAGKTAGHLEVFWFYDIESNPPGAFRRLITPSPQHEQLELGHSHAVAAT